MTDQKPVGLPERNWEQRQRTQYEALADENAHIRSETAKDIEAKDAIIVSLATTGQALRDLVNTELAPDKAIAAADAWDKAIADSQAGKKERKS